MLKPRIPRTAKPIDILPEKKTRVLCVLLCLAFCRVSLTPLPDCFAFALERARRHLAVAAMQASRLVGRRRPEDALDTRHYRRRGDTPRSTAEPATTTLLSLSFPDTEMCMRCVQALCRHGPTPWLLTHTHTSRTLLVLRRQQHADAGAGKRKLRWQRLLRRGVGYMPWGDGVICVQQEVDRCSAAIAIQATWRAHASRMAIQPDLATRISRRRAAVAIQRWYRIRPMVWRMQVSQPGLRVCAWASPSPTALCHTTHADVGGSGSAQR